MEQLNPANKLSLIHPDTIERVITDYEKENKDNTNLDEFVDYIIDSDTEYEPHEINKKIKSCTSTRTQTVTKFPARKCKST